MKRLSGIALLLFIQLFYTPANAQVTDIQIQQEIEEQSSIDVSPGNREIGEIDIEAQRAANLSNPDLSGVVFGREIFSQKQLSFEPDLNIPTPKEYKLSAGDEIFVQVWGNSELNLKLRISPEGTVLIPDLGPVSVSGLTVVDAEDKLRRELGRIMNTLADDEAETFVSISLSQIRSIKINIVGEVIAPGTYTLPSFATLFNALYAAGGVNDIGTLRSIKVYRNSREVANLDVYAFLLQGKYENNIRLEENDMIMVGPYDQLAVVKGKVKRNRIFELKGGETLQQLLEMAGGFTGDAYTKDVQIKRKSDTHYQIATVGQDKFGSFAIQDGDSLFVSSIIPIYENRVTVSGAIWRPGEYELTPQVHTVRQLVEQAGGLKGDEFRGRAQIIRLNHDFTNTVIAIDVVGILNGDLPDVELQSEDKLNIPSLFDLREPYTIKVSGAVNIDEKVKILPYRKNMTIEDAIIMAGGLKESAASINVEVARRIKNPLSTESSSRQADVFNLTLRPDFSAEHGEPIFILEPFDEVNVRFSPGYREQQTVKIRGEITFAGDYVLSEKNMRLSDMIFLAGGITPDAYIRGANLQRKLSEDELRRLKTIMELSASTKESRDSIAVFLSNVSEYAVGIDMEKALANPGSFHDIVLRDGDVLYIPEYQSTVKVSGTVIYPNTVTYTKGMSVKDCLSQAGGYTDMSRKFPIVVYMNGKVGTTKRVLFFKRYPKVEPGSEVLVPHKTRRDRPATLAEILSISSSATSMAAMVALLVDRLK